MMIVSNMVVCKSANTPGCLTRCGEECLSTVLEPSSGLAAALAMSMPDDVLGALGGMSACSLASAPSTA